MIPCTRLYAELIESLMGQDEKNLPTRQLHGIIALWEHTPSINVKWFQRLLKFSKHIAQFSVCDDALC